MDALACRARMIDCRGVTSPAPYVGELHTILAIHWSRVSSFLGPLLRGACLCGGGHSVSTTPTPQVIPMGDKSPKAKSKNKKQTDAAKTKKVAANVAKNVVSLLK